MLLLVQSPFWKGHLEKSLGDKYSRNPQPLCSWNSLNIIIFSRKRNSSTVGILGKSISSYLVIYGVFILLFSPFKNESIDNLFRKIVLHTNWGKTTSCTHWQSIVSCNTLLSWNTALAHLSSILPDLIKTTIQKQVYAVYHRFVIFLHYKGFNPSTLSLPLKWPSFPNCEI